VSEELLNRNPILESFILLRVLLVLVAQGLNPTIFRVSRVSLDFINRLVNTKNGDVILGRIDDSLRKRFSGLFFSFFFYFMKMFNIKLMCN
jgi:hypothetical protein